MSTPQARFDFNGDRDDAVSSPQASAPSIGPEYAYNSVEEFEQIVGHPVNEAFRMGWDMARTLKSHIEALSEAPNSQVEPRCGKE